MIKIFNSVIGQKEYINHRLSTFLRIEVAVDELNTANSIRVYLIDGSETSVIYDTSVAQELTDFNTSISNIEAATL